MKKFNINKYLKENVLITTQINSCLKIFYIPVDNLSRKNTEKVIKELLDREKNNIDWRRDFEIQRLKEERIKKLNKLYKK